MNRDTRLSDVLHVLLHMAQVKEPRTSEVLARSMGTNPAVFRRTMAGLRRAGHVISGKGHGGGWQLARPLEEITLLAVYEALERPTLFAIGSRGRHPECRIEDGVNSALAETMRQAESLLLQRFGQVTLDQLMPSQARALSQTCSSALPAAPRGD
ncbi:Rrf2 family transcriptional regulator (plasmid) [Rhizobium rosettiformans]|uniref:Rrf2 family transcriptional regulator n=1 Tax=Rhizobium rosettiformans TaxID=1368430 RepID=A0ABX7F1J4_9HYPH|nr:Rrf2 family transcriptional regulator [Rhizobium rosettiformans]QRF54176.1 Rrf2 family transcriptional regulator [Rhizobium rosettiformans]